MQDIGISHQVASSHPEVHRQRCGHVCCYRSGRGTCRLLQQSVVRYIEAQHRQTSASSELSVVTCTGASEHIIHVLSELHWLPITARIQYKIAPLLTHKVMSTQQPAYLTALFRQSQPTRTLRPSSRRILDSDTPRTMFANRAFCFAAPRIWNELPKTLTEDGVPFQIFKRDLKTFLFKTIFSNLIRNRSAPAILL